MVSPASASWLYWVQMAVIVCLLALASLLGNVLTFKRFFFFFILFSLGAHSQFICYVGNVCSSSTSGITSEEQCCNQVLVHCTSPGCFVTFRDGVVSEGCQHCYSNLCC